MNDVVVVLILLCTVVYLCWFCYQLGKMNQLRKWYRHMSTLLDHSTKIWSDAELDLYDEIEKWKD